MNEELSAEVAGVLGEHDDPPGWMWSDSDQMVYACECGDHYVAGAIDVIQEQDVLAAAEWHRNHQAAALLPLLARIDREARAEAWDEGYEAGYNDCLFDTRGLSTDSDAAEFPHSNPYRTTSDVTTEEAE